MKQEIVVGTRESKLAMWQTGWVVERIQRVHPEYRYHIKGIRTTGDNILDVALSKIGDKGLFTKELELALFRGEIDMAVHSMKDLPTELPVGLAIGAICQRVHPGDVLFSREGKRLEELPEGALVGTSSLRRCAQLLHYRSDLKMVNLRGNINTRLRKLEEGHFDATVLAFAGVHRMGWDDRITQLIPYEICLPAVGQGAIGVEVRADDEKVRNLVNKIDHLESRLAITAERALLKKLEGGCQIPIGALGTLKNGRLNLEGVVASLDGKELVRTSLVGEAEDAAGIGVRLAEILVQLGAGDILSKLRQENGCHE